MTGVPLSNGCRTRHSRRCRRQGAIASIALLLALFAVNRYVVLPEIGGYGDDCKQSASEYLTAEAGIVEVLRARLSERVCYSPP
jgi:hypothetical protein